MSLIRTPYQGYYAQIEVDVEGGILFGRVIDLKDVITFQGESVADAIRAFHRSVDAYLAFCAQEGEKPDKPFSGNLPFRTSSEHHRDIFRAALLQGKSINGWMDETLANAAKKVLEEHNVLEEPSIQQQMLLPA